MPAQRGVIRNINRAMQLNNFKDLLRKSPMSKNMTITPTDIDGLIDYNGVAFVYMEGKLMGKQTEEGQRLAIENVVNSHHKAGHAAMGLIYEHNIPSNEQIYVAYCFVRGIYCGRRIRNLCGDPYNGKWWWPKLKDIKVIDALEAFEIEFQIYNQ
jgi:hypothetical protein